MDLDEFINERQLQLTELVEQQTSPNQEEDAHWSFADSFTNTPDITIMDIDEAVINELNNKGAIFVDGKKVPVNIGGSERWSIASKEYLYDENNKLILPNVALIIESPELDQSRYSLPTREGSNNISVKDIIRTSSAGEMTQRTIEITPPIPLICSYKIVVWAGYMSHIRTITSKLFHHFTLNAVYIKDLFFTTQMDNTIDFQSNFSDYGSDERLMKATLSLKVHAYIIDSNTSYRARNKVLNTKTQITISEMVGDVPANKYKWRSPYELTHRKV